ncbi:MAG: hypothetical protein VKL59_06220 [Nostocaceae cyanobacterium]|nr:hypothetical protein [Nostocaceae cyanobacterium]
MMTPSNKLKLACWVTSAAVLVPKAALSQTEINTSELDNSDAGKPRIPSNPNPDKIAAAIKDIAAPIAEPEILKESPLLANNASDSAPKSLVKTQEIALEDTQINSQIATVDKQANNISNSPQIKPNQSASLTINQNIKPESNTLLNSPDDGNSKKEQKEPAESINETDVKQQDNNSLSSTVIEPVNITQPEFTHQSDSQQKDNFSSSIVVKPTNTTQAEVTKKPDFPDKQDNSQPANVIQPTNAVKPEVNIPDSLTKKDNSQSANVTQPSNIAKPEFTTKSPKQQLTPVTLDKQEISAVSNTRTNLPAVIERDRQPTQEQPKENAAVDPQYIIPPRIAANQKINPFTTNVPLNSTFINHLTENQFFTGVTFSDTLNTNFDVNGLIKINSQIEESLTKDNVFTVEQTGSYVQLQTVRKKRQISVEQKEPQTILGVQLQLSLTGSCFLGEGTSDQQCTYTPGLSTDRNSIDPDTLFPKRIIQTSKVGDVVAPETLAAIKEPGFQRGVTGKEIGIDLFFPNAGSISGNSQSNETELKRKEEIENTLVGIYSTVRQVVRANDKEAVLGRTIRGYGFIVDDKNALLNTALQLGNFVLPDADPQVTASDNPVNKNINVNLFLAANNTRLPANSFTFYNAGIGRAESPKPGNTSLSKVPTANYNSIWLGVSPVIKRSLSNNERYEVTGPRRVVTAAGGEGGVDSNVDILSLVNGQRFDNNNLKDFYGQVYLTLYNQDVNAIRSSQYTEKTNYYPHISFSGNITGSDSVFRYYAGVIASEEIKPYVGTDYTKNTLDGWTYSAAAIGYLNPDLDYYSQVQGSVAKRINLSKNTNLVLSTGINYALDRPTRIDNFVIDSAGSSLSVGARANLGNVSVGVINYFGDILPNSIANTLLADLSVKFSDNFSVSAYYTPINESTSRSRYGASAQLKLGNQQTSPILGISWSNNEYSFGNDPNGNKLDITDNVFSVFLRGSL